MEIYEIRDNFYNIGCPHCGYVNTKEVKDINNFKFTCLHCKTSYKETISVIEKTKPEVETNVIKETPGPKGQRIGFYLDDELVKKFQDRESAAVYFGLPKDTISNYISLNKNKKPVPRDLRYL